MKFLAASALLLSTAVLAKPMVQESEVKTVMERINDGQQAEICGYACQYTNLIKEEQAEALDEINAQLKEISEREYKREEIEAEIVETQKLTKEFMEAIFGDAAKEIEEEGEGEKEDINVDEIVENLEEGDELEKQYLEEMKKQVIENYDAVLKEISEEKDDEAYKPRIEYQNQMEKEQKEIEEFVQELTNGLFDALALEEETVAEEENTVDENVVDEEIKSENI